MDYSLNSIFIILDVIKTALTMFNFYFKNIHKYTGPVTDKIDSVHNATATIKLNHDDAQQTLSFSNYFSFHFREVQPVLKHLRLN